MSESLILFRINVWEVLILGGTTLTKRAERFARRIVRMARPKAQLSTSVYMKFCGTRRTKQATRGHVRIRSLARSPCSLPILCARSTSKSSNMSGSSAVNWEIAFVTVILQRCSAECIQILKPKWLRSVYWRNT